MLNSERPNHLYLLMLLQDLGDNVWYPASYILHAWSTYFSIPQMFMLPDVRWMRSVEPPLNCWFSLRIRIQASLGIRGIPQTVGSKAHIRAAAHVPS